MKKREYKLLEELKNKRISKEEIKRTLNFSSDDLLVQSLFELMSNQLDQDAEDISYLKSVISLVKDIIYDSIDIDRKMMKRKIKKLIEKIDTIEIENRSIDNKENDFLKTLTSVESDLMKLDYILETCENRKYKILMFIIEENKNLDYLEKTLDYFPNSVNVKDKDGNSLYFNLIQKYIKQIRDQNEDKEVLLYLNNIILLLGKRKELEFSQKEQSRCLELIFNELKSTHMKSKDSVKQLKRLEELLIEKEDHIDYQQLLSKYHINIEFPNKIIEEIGTCQCNIDQYMYPGYVEITDYIMTIDRFNAKELDDGLSIKTLKNGNYLYGIHITDPLAYMPYSSVVIQEAITREENIYIDRCNSNQSREVISLFPESFSRNQGSLNKGLKRLAKSYYFELDRNGELVDQKYLNTIITVSKRATYNEVNYTLEKGSNDHQFENTIRLLDELTEKLEQKLAIDDLYMDIEKKKRKTIEREKQDNTRAGKIVSTAMIYTGYQVANYFAKEGYPTLYRVHQMNNEAKEKLKQEILNLSPTSNKSMFKQLYEVLLGIYPKATYDIKGRHEGLGLDHYCHVTSPIRRAADIVVDHSLNICYFKNPSDKEIQKLEKEILQAKGIINKKSDDIDQFMNEYVMLKKKRKRS